MQADVLRVLHLAPARSEPSGLGAYADMLRRAADGVPRLKVYGGEGLGHHELPLRGKGLLPRVRELVGSWENAGSLVPFDVVHVEIGGGSYREYYLAQELTRRCLGPPRVFTLHDPPFTVGRTHLERWWGRGLAARASRRAWEVTGGMLEERRILEGAGAIITLSTGGARALGRRFPGLKVPVTVVKHVSFSSEGPPAAALSAPEVGLLWLGFWVKGAGVEDLFAALASIASRSATDLPAWRLRVAGGPAPGANGAVPPLEMLARRWRVSGNVEFVGRVPEEELPLLFSRSHVLVVPRRRRGFLRRELQSVSGSMLRGMSRGLAVVATDARATAEEITSGRNGILIPAGDVSGLADALREVIIDRELRVRLGRAAQEHVRLYHSPETVMRDHDAVYRKVKGSREGAD